jgi:hypothetical protein
MNKKRLNGTILVLMVFFLAACAPVGPAPHVIPTEQLGTAIVQTAAFLATQTALHAPLPTATQPADTSIPTVTNTRTATPTETETATPFIIIIPSRTPTITQTRTATNTVTPTNTKSQPCMVAAQVPANNTAFTPGAFFDTVWTVVNTGALTWSLGNVDMIYDGGNKMHLNGDVLDLPATTVPSQSLVLIVHMQAPTSKGTFTETWSLKEGATIHCTMSVMIAVK